MKKTAQPNDIAAQIPDLDNGELRYYLQTPRTHEPAIADIKEDAVEMVVTHAITTGIIPRVFAVTLDRAHKLEAAAMKRFNKTSGLFWA